LFLFLFFNRLLSSKGNGWSFFAWQD
jgi:hypothetical protein